MAQARRYRRGRRHNEEMAVIGRIRAAAYRLALGLLRAWWFARRPRSSGVRCILRSGDAVVLVRHSYGDRRWMLPGGRLRRGEDAIATARREMNQELGVACQRWQVIGCLAARTSYRRESSMDGFRRHSTFYVEGEVATTVLQPRRGELSDAGWFPAGALPDDCSDSVDVAANAGWLQRHRSATSARRSWAPMSRRCPRRDAR
jgi:8-oxo-dGTP pyrophosphatase MutT (NUDIX family)